MPRYFFHTHFGDEVVNDPDGEDLADADAAFEAARTMALQLLQGAGGDPALLRATLMVTGEDGEVVLEFPLAEAVHLAPPGDGEPETRH